VVDLSMIQ